MTGMAQKNYPQIRTATYLMLPVLLSVTFSPLPAHALFVENAENAPSNNSVYFFIAAILFPITVAAFAFFASPFAKAQSPRAQKNIFIAACVFPIACLIVNIAPNLFTGGAHATKPALISVGVFCIWAIVHYLVYVIYTYMTNLPVPAPFCRLRRKHVFIALAGCALCCAAYLTYPKIYFQYRLLLAQTGDVQSQLWVGRTYERPTARRILGDHAQYVVPNYYRARDWLEKAAAQGEVQAYAELAELYSGLEGQEMLFAISAERRSWLPQVNLETARQWAEKAAASNTRTDLLPKINDMIARGHKWKGSFWQGMNIIAVSSGHYNFILTIFAFLDIGYANTGFFILMYRTYRRLKPKALPHYKRFIATAIFWPTLVFLVAIVSTMPFTRGLENFLLTISVSTAAITLIISLFAYRFVRTVAAQPPDLQERYIRRRGWAYFVLGLILIFNPITGLMR